MSSHDKPMKTDINDPIILLFSTPAFGKFGNFNDIFFIRMSYTVRL